MSEERRRKGEREGIEGRKGVGERSGGRRKGGGERGRRVLGTVRGKQVYM